MPPRFSLAVSRYMSQPEVTDNGARTQLPDDIDGTHALLDRGVFQKSLVFGDPLTGERWRHGRQSSGVILYGFVRFRKRLPPGKCEHAMLKLLDRIGVSTDDVEKRQFGGLNGDAQRTFDFTPAEN